MRRKGAIMVQQDDMPDIVDLHARLIRVDYAALDAIREGECLRERLRRSRTPKQFWRVAQEIEVLAGKAEALAASGPDLS
jgi:hypothetical protein